MIFHCIADQFQIGELPMASAPWLLTLRSRFLPFESRPARRELFRTRTKTAKPRLESLEERTLLSAYAVSTTADSGPGSLRDAINRVNLDTGHLLYASPSNPNVDEIDFSITAATDTYGGFNATNSVATIMPLSPLPAIINAVFINGYSQAGSSQNTFGIGPNSPGHNLGDGDNAVLTVELNGAGAGNAAVGLELDAPYCIVSGLDVNSFSGYGIWINNFTGHDSVTGDFVGTDPSGMIAMGNGGGDLVQYNSPNGGIVLTSSNYNAIGGTDPADRNLISGNDVAGLVITDSDNLYTIPITFVGNTVQGNLIGTDSTGTQSLGNATVGIAWRNGFWDTTIGGSVGGARNIISGNTSTNYVPGVSFGGLWLGGISGGGVRVEGNFIGTDITGEKPLGNAGDGVSIGNSDGNITIGGLEPGAGNVISANLGTGISTGYANDCHIQGNLIGTDATGMIALGNQFGIFITQYGDATGDVIGGVEPGARNLISGNSTDLRLDCNGVVVQGNFLGTEITGKALLDHSLSLILAGFSTNNLIGGDIPGAANVIGNGIQLTGAGVQGNLFQGNFIGTDLTGTIRLGTSGAFELGGASNNIIGGTEPGQGNVIAFSSYWPGIRLYSGTGNTIRGNSIHDNAGGGIFLNSAAGANNNQTYPTLTAASATAGGTVISGTLASVPNSTFSIDFYSNTAPDPSGFGEGEFYLGSAMVSTDGAGNASFTATVAAAPSGQRYLSATATDPVGDTSQFAVDIVLPVTPTPSASLSGTVFIDFNDDGQIDFGEKGIAGVAIALTGTDELGNAVNFTTATDADGAYVFLNLRPGSYRISESQPAGYLPGVDTVGTAGGSLAATDQFFIQLDQGVDGLNYNFGEQPPTTGAVTKGQSAGIGFWNNKNGQALILALNGGGTSTRLADWLAATMPNTFGIHAGSNNLSGKNNAFVAALFQQDFLMKGVKLDAQVLATALSVYATNSTLDSTTIAAHYGFTVSGTGLGTDTVNVGSNGAAFGVTNNTNMTVLGLLWAIDAQAVNGVFYSGNATKRTEANSLFSALNEAGSIS
jgi:parallel beta-helix repeat protein